MGWELTNDRPIYLQLVEQIEWGIITGKYAAGEKLASVRDFATQAGVNPNTMQRAFAELEQIGLVYTQRTSGRFITDDEGKIRMAKEGLAQNQIAEFLQNMNRLGFEVQETIQLLERIIKEGNGNGCIRQ